MPCKWHGFDHDCVVKNSFFNPNSPCPFFDSDGEVCYSICSKYKCLIWEKAQAIKRTMDSDDAMDDDNDCKDSEAQNDGNCSDEPENHTGGAPEKYCYHILGYDPAVLAHLSPDV
jgi:hypothetical protein